MDTNSITEARTGNQETSNDSSTTHNDTSMENTYGMGFRSGSQASPQGRSLREYEEQMTALRKENFNLKLRIYFLEEKNSGGTSSDHDTIMKQNIDLKVENEAYRNELMEKQELLCQAAKAMELMEDNQKCLNEQNQIIIDELNHKLELLEIEMKAMENVADQRKFHSLESGICDFLLPAGVNIMELQQKIIDLENNLAQHRHHNEELSMKLETMVEAQDNVKMLEQQVSELKFDNAELQSQVEEKSAAVSTVEFVQCNDQLYELKKQYADIECQLKDVEEKYSKKSLDHSKACSAIQVLTRSLNEQEKVIDSMREQSTYGNSAHPQTGIQEVLSNSLQIVATNIEELQEYKTDVDKKQKEIRKLFLENDHLKSDLKKLQFQISKNTKDLQPMDNTKKEIDWPTNQFCNIFEHKNLNTVIQQKQIEIENAQQDAEKAQTWRKRCSEVCALLTVRLRELAMFLDSLLCNEFKGLCADRRKAIRISVENSLDLSKSIDMSSASIIKNMTAFNETGGRPSIANESLLNLSNISAFLNISGYSMLDLENKENRTSNVGQASEADLIDNLKSEIMKLRNALATKKANTKLNTSLPLPTFDYDEPQSEGESSEPNHELKYKIKKLKTKKHFVSNFVQGASTSTSENEERISNMAQVKEDRQVQQRLSDIQKNDKREIMAIKQNAETMIAQIREERDQMQVLLRVSEIKLQQLHQDFAQIKLAHANELVTIMENEEEKRVQLEKRLKDEFNQSVRDFEEQLEKNYIARDIYNKLVQQCDELSEKMDELTTQLNTSNDSIKQMKQEIVERDNEKETLRRNLDNTTLQLSKLGVQFNRELVKRTQELENYLKTTGEEKLQLNSKIAKMESTNALLQKELLSKTTRTDNSVILTKNKQQQTVTSDYSQSGGYTSEDFVCQSTAAKLRFNNSSPDLGIESSENMKMDGPVDKNTKLSPLKENDQRNNAGKPSHVCDLVDLENADLKKKLIRTKRALEETYAKLKASNERKEIIEKDIRQQILKTQNVLKNVRTNMENELGQKEKKRVLPS